MYSQIFKLHSEILKALSHPKRLEILHLLRGQELSVSEIQNMLNLPQANLSQHLIVLRDAQIVKTRRRGKKILYSITHKNFIKASDLIRQVLIEKHKGSPLADEFTYKMDELVPLCKDPVCGMRLSPKTASYAEKYKSNEYYFCASGCLEKFKSNPEKYVH